MKTRTIIEKINVTDLSKWLEDATRYMDKIDTTLQLSYSDSFYTAICNPKDGDTLAQRCAKVIEHGGGIELIDDGASEPVGDNGNYVKTRGIVAYPFRTWHIKRGFEGALNHDEFIDQSKVALLGRLVRFYSGEIQESEIFGERDRLAYELLQVVATGGVIIN